MGLLEQGGLIAEVIPKIQNKDFSKFEISERSSFQLTSLILKIHDNMDLLLCTTGMIKFSL